MEKESIEQRWNGLVTELNDLLNDIGLTINKKQSEKLLGILNRNRLLQDDNYKIVGQLLYDCFPRDLMDLINDYYKEKENNEDI